MDLTLYNEYFVLESFESVIDDSSIFNPANDQAYLEELYTEATSGVNVQNILSKLIRFIVRSLRWLWKKIVQFGNWLKNKILGRNKKSADQIVEEVIGSTSNSSNQSRIVNNRAKNNANVPNKKKQINGQPKEEEKIVKVTIPSSDKSSVKVDDIVEVAFKDIQIAFDNDKIKLNYQNDLSPSSFMNMRLNSIRPPIGKSAPDPAQKYYVAELIRNKSLRDEFDAIINDTEKIFKTTAANPGIPTAMNKLNDTQNIQKLTNRCNAFYEKIVAMKISYDQDVSLNDFSEFSKILKHAVDVFSSFEADFIKPTAFNSQLQSNENPNWQVRSGRNSITAKQLEAFDKIRLLVTVFSFGMNGITEIMKRIYMIDAKYLGVISDTETLSKFVEKMAAYGIPSKYIMYNSYLIASPELNGSNSKANADKPIWGQSRCVFFPTNENSVVKIAYNPLGTIGNKNEAYVTKLLHGSSESKLIANIRKISKNKYVTEGERVNTSASVSWNTCLSIKSKLNESPRLKNIGVEITDIHPANVGSRSDGSLCIVDYGGIERTEIS